MLMVMGVCGHKSPLMSAGCLGGAARVACSPGDVLLRVIFSSEKGRGLQIYDYVCRTSEYR